LDSAENVRPAVDWEAVRADYEGGLERGSTVEIAARHGITPKTLQNHVAAGGWRRRAQRHSVDRGAIITRMFGLLERQIIQLEQHMKETGEKEVAVLGKLATTLEKLIEIDKAETGSKAAQTPMEQKEIEDLRNKIAVRLAQLRRG